VGVNGQSALTSQRRAVERIPHGVIKPAAERKQGVLSVVGGVSALRESLAGVRHRRTDW
jgi:hypothetical protein